MPTGQTNVLTIYYTSNFQYGNFAFKRSVPTHKRAQSAMKTRSNKSKLLSTNTRNRLEYLKLGVKRFTKCLPREIARKRESKFSVNDNVKEKFLNIEKFSFKFSELPKQTLNYATYNFRGLKVRHI